MCNKNTFDTANQLQLKAMVYIDGAVTQSNIIAHTKTHTHYDEKHRPYADKIIKFDTCATDRSILNRNWAMIKRKRVID